MNLRVPVVHLVELSLCQGRKLDLSDSDSFLENGIIDSLSMMELVNQISTRFHVEVSDDDLVPENFDSIHGLLEFLARKGVSG